MKQILTLIVVAVLSWGVFSQLRQPAGPSYTPIATSPDLTIDGHSVDRVFEFTASRVIDGDSIRVESNSGTFDIRLASVDAPELQQTFGIEARDHLSRMLGNLTITAWDIGTDQYDRTVAFLFIKNSDGSLFEINSQMIRDGFAWHAINHSDNQILASLESQAQYARLGLWSDQAMPIAPWVFRSSQ